ncbi:MAG TPA: YeaH/YhbH family protein, partial [Syntrophomonadaceae bacterium]|nr:YeaH/YhbH family protein [Syntrophomonadaceae bacterium]
KDRVIKVPVRGIKEFQFIYGDNQPGVASGKGKEKRGDRFPGPAANGTGGGDGAGNREGEEYYETEITLEELVQYLFEDLELPFMERKKFAFSETQRSIKHRGIQLKGIPPRLSKKKSMAERIKRKKGMERTLAELQSEEEIERFPFREEDLRYQRSREEMRPESNAVVICIMDNSGSMYLNKKYLARTFFFLLYQFVRCRYAQVELVFINHSTTAREVNEEEFFHRGESGGTLISSGYEKALEIIWQRYNPELWNVYAFHCSDGDNWPEDVPRAVQRAQELCEVCNLFGYGEIISSWTAPRSMIEEFENGVEERNFVAVSFGSKEEVWPAFRKLLTLAERE